MKDWTRSNLLHHRRSLELLVETTDSPQERRGARRRMREIDKLLGRPSMRAVNRVARQIERGQVPRQDRWERGLYQPAEEVRL